MKNTNPAPTNPAPRRPAVRPAIFALPIFAMLTLLLGASVATATPIQVNASGWGDDLDATTCTLWEAVKTTRDLSGYGGCSWDGEATINLQADETYATQGQLPKINSTVTIWGNGATLERGVSTIPHRFFNVGTTATLNLIALTLRGGSATRGGAIWVSTGATLDGIRLQLLANQATAGGGAIYSRGNIDLAFATLRDNSANNGGAIAAEQGRLDILDSTLVGNLASNHGGALAVWSGVDQLTAHNSTFSANQAYRGGALYRAGTATPAADSLIQITFEDNQATQLGAGNTLYFSGSTHLELAKSALHGTDADSNLCAGDLSGLQSLGHNAATDASCALTHIDDHPAVSFSLGALSSEGAFTPVHPPLCDAPAGAAYTCSILLDQYPCGSVADGPDQRGVNRYQFGDGLQNENPRCDIGAYESICDTNTVSIDQLAIGIFTDQYLRNDQVLNSGACAGRGQPVQFATVPANGCEVLWYIYFSQGLGIQAIWFLEDTCTLDCLTDPAACKDQCTVDPNDWTVGLPPGLQVSAGATTPGDSVFILDAPTCSVPTSRYVIEFANGAIDFWDPELDIDSGEGT